MVRIMETCIFSILDDVRFAIHYKELLTYEWIISSSLSQPCS